LIKKNIEIQEIADCIWLPEIRKKWDPFMACAKMIKLHDWLLMEYEIKFPVKWRKFKDYVKVKIENNELTVISYGSGGKGEKEPCNYFTCIKINKKGNEISLNFMSQIDYCIGESRKLPELSAKMMGLTFKAFISYLCTLNQM
jgi:hypothetical protein